MGLRVAAIAADRQLWYLSLALQYKTRGYDMMKSKPITDQKIIASQSLIQLIRKSILIYIIVAVALLIFCITLGWRTLDNIGTGFIYGSLCLMLFGTLTLFGNTVPAQLSELSLPKYSPTSTEPRKETKIDGSVPTNRGKELFLVSLICGALLFVTGLILRTF
jgi:hypothetical protein